jgi:hypothetical protein
MSRDPSDPVLGRLLRRAHLYDDPRSFEAGVREAYAMLERPTPAEPPAPPERMVGAQLIGSAR